MNVLPVWFDYIKYNYTLFHSLFIITYALIHKSFQWNTAIWFFNRFFFSTSFFRSLALSPPHSLSLKRMLVCTFVIYIYLFLLCTKYNTHFSLHYSYIQVIPAHYISPSLDFVVVVVVVETGYYKVDRNCKCNNIFIQGHPFALNQPYIYSYYIYKRKIPKIEWS